ncbi:succinate-semialdehyde dehydrogenase (NADP(+)) [Burkholderia sp. KK1]|nr:succinate-semialdehyde dehydrogenase (NADP(+)) [Burkholderia sp. KK1]
MTESNPLSRLADPSLLRTLAYIDGAWCAADDARTFAVDDPATGETIADVPLMTGIETRRAIEAGERAQREWRAQTGAQRASILKRWHALMVANTDDLAIIMSAEQGKPFAEAKGEIGYAASFIEWFAEQAKRIDGDVLASPAADKRLLVTKEPIGVCAAITPWNFPAAMITRKAAPALAAGCAMIVKPAEATPLSALALAELAHRAGVPAGVFSVVVGDPREIGAEMTGNPIVRKLSFTGSTPVGRLLMSQCAPTVKKLSLELGGNAPFIVFDDADLDAAVEGALASKYRNAGQTCVCTNRFYVQDGVYDAFADKFAAAVGRIKVGNGFENGVTQGPLINEAAVGKVEAHIADALAHGARVIAGGKRHAAGKLFFEPTVIDGVTASMRFATEETFGPVAPLFRFHDEREAIDAANATEFGLAAYFYSRDIGRIWRVSEALEYGMVGINTGLISNEVAPFGGVKQSGLGREGSKYGIEEYLELKYLCMGGL